jgi:2-amino-4-hydroxy-6-hydroxymethyldihydropteridine diphosphokinase
LSYPKSPEQNWYLNAVIALQTTLGLHELFAYLQEIELALGRTRSDKWAPRPLDLDLLFYGDIIYRDHDLSLPHREIIKRRFVLEPFCDLAPDFIHPEMQMTMRELLEILEDSLQVERLPDLQLAEISAS